MPITRVVLLLVTFGFASAASSVALAQDTAPASSDDEEAHLRFEAGRVAFSRGRFEDALADFERAYALSHRYALLYNIGQAYDRLRRDVAGGATAVAVADFDGIGAPEIVVSRVMGPDGVASIYDWTTGAEVYPLTTGARLDVVSGRYDLDPPIDVAFVGADGSLQIWINQTR